MVSADIPWSRPGGDEEPPPEAYPGPPQTVPADPDWQVPVTETTAPPRPLPAVDHEALDLAEDNAAKVTYAVGLAALGLLVIIAVFRLV